MPTLTIGKTVIEYTVRRSSGVERQRIIVTPQGVEVLAGPAASQREISAFIRSRGQWVLDEWEKMRERVIETPWPEHFVTGAKIPFRGQRVSLTVKPGSGKSVSVAYRGGFQVEWPTTLLEAEREARIKGALELWLRSTMETDTREFVKHYSAKLGRKPRYIRIKDEKHLWGGCGIEGTISLNWRLVFAPKPILEYVVVHELCHLIHPHHSPAFWSLVKSVLPDAEQRKKWLEEQGAEYEL